MLLSNISSSSVACATIASMTIQVVPEPKLSSQCFPVQSRCGSCPAPVPYPSDEALDVPALPLLIDAFVQGAQIEEDLSKRVRKGKLHFLAGVFANLSAVRAHQNSVKSGRTEMPSSRLQASSSFALLEQPILSNKTHLALNTPWQKSFRSQNTKTSSGVEVLLLRSSACSDRYGF